MAAPDAVLSALFAQARHHRTDALGCRIAWQQWPSPGGDAQPLLLIHGGFGSWSHWAANIATLSQHFALWTLDLPGLGRSGDMPRPWSTGRITRRVLAGWQTLQPGERPVDIAGFSFGGIIAGQLAAALGKRCSRCLLIGASGFGHLHRQVDLLAPPAADTDAITANAIHRENLSRLMLHDPTAIDALAVYIHADNLARHRLRSRGMAGSNDLADTLGDIPARLVGIWGEHDATAGGMDKLLARKQLFLAAQADAQFHVLPATGHWAMYEQPDALHRLIINRS